ncbi:MAG: serine--tRNA ligase, partial [Thermodesulfobacteriota bacterium]
MLDAKYIRDNLDFVKKKMEERGAQVDLYRFLALDEERRGIIQEVEELEHERNSGSKKVGELKKHGRNEEAERFQIELK